MNPSYSILAEFYDKFNGDSIDYEKWAEFIKGRFLKEGLTENCLVLDLACGTGKMTLEMSKLGFDVTGVDLSPEMLSVARENCAKEDFYPLLLCQDLCELDLYGSYDGAICCLDSLNYLTGKNELKKFFSLLKNFINHNGIFIFDVNTKSTYENVYANNCYTYETDNLFCVWQNRFNKRTKLCDFDLTFFEKKKSGLWERKEEHQQERFYSEDEILSALKENEFDLIDIVSDFSNTPAKDTDKRHYYICKRK